MFLGVRPGTTRIPPAPHIKDERKEDRLAAAHAHYQSVSDPLYRPVHPVENHRWVRPQGQPGRTERDSLIKWAREPAVEASG